MVVFTKKLKLKIKKEMLPEFSFLQRLLTKKNKQHKTKWGKICDKLNNSVLEKYCQFPHETIIRGKAYQNSIPKTNKQQDELQTLPKINPF